ncbi:MAG: ribonuclease P protein component [Candidatus Colwellbacteria bacterium]|nr:ribonuclease P protein component [Candidatus Colwellbacteria bacterium]
MLAKKFRLPVGSFPKNIRAAGSGEFTSLRVFPNKLTYNRFGVVFKSGTIKSAVQRNKLKRIAFDWATNFLVSSASTGYKDVLLIFYQGVPKLKKQDIIKELQNYERFIQ